MYQEDKLKINWFKIGLRLVIVLLVILLSLKLISLVVKNNTTNNYETLMEQKLEELDEIAKDYFSNNLPSNVGDSITLTLQDLMDNNISNEIVDTKNKTCDSEKTNIKATLLETEYQVKTTLVCDNYEDYITTSIPLDIETTETTTTIKTTTNTTTARITTTKVTTKTTTNSIRTYIVEFNSNGGNQVSSQIIKENGKVDYVIPNRIGYTFVGWYYHGVEFDFTTSINQNYVLTAKWTKN